MCVCVCVGKGQTSKLMVGKCETTPLFKKVTNVDVGRRHMHVGTRCRRHWKVRIKGRVDFTPLQSVHDGVLDVIVNVKPEPTIDGGCTCSTRATKSLVLPP